MDNKTKSIISRTFFGYVWPNKRMLFSALGLMVISAITTALTARLLGPVIDEVFTNKNTELLTIIPLAIIGLSIIKGFSSYGTTVIMAKMGVSIITNLRKALFKHLLYSDITMHNDEASGRLVSRFTNDINLMKSSVSGVFLTLGRDLLTFVALLIVMLIASWQLTLIAFVLSPLILLFVRKIGLKLRKISRTLQVELGNLTSRLDESFRGVRTIKAYSKEEYEINRTNSLLDNIYNKTVKKARTSAALSPLMEAFGGLSVAAVIWYGGYEVINGTTTAGDFMTFIGSLLMAYKPMKSLSKVNSVVQDGIASGERLYSILDKAPVIVDKKDAKPIKVNKGEIIIDKLSFKYSDGTQALSNVSLKAEAGKTIALVGESGSGKSSLINLLLRFYDKTSGSIKIDGQEISDVQLKSVRDSIAFVSQDIFLFDDSVIENIKYGNQKATKTQVLAATKVAMADKFITQLEGGYNSQIGQGGAKLSGGQRQRVSIARAILKDTQILLLDEATSALDPKTEREFKVTLEKISKNKTTIIVAHRLSTIKAADVIYVFSKGKVIDSGTHDQLMKGSKHYQNLFVE